MLNVEVGAVRTADRDADLPGNNEFDAEASSAFEVSLTSALAVDRPNLYVYP